MQEKEKFPSQPHQNPKGIHELEAQERESSQVREVKAVITLRNSKEVDMPTSKQEHVWTRIFHVRPHSIGETRFVIIL